MSGCLDGKVVAITGAGRGIGRELALHCAAQGAAVLVNDPGVAQAGDGGDAAPAETTANDIVAAGGKAAANFGNVADPKEAAGIIEDAVAKFGRIDAVVNNAGILRDKTFAKMELEDFAKVVDVHLMGSVVPTKALWDHFRENEYGRIVYTTSASGLYGNFGQSNYGAAKAAMVGLMNVQFAVKDGVIYLIEVNPRASRTVPFVAKAIGRPVAKIAARVMAGEPLSNFEPFDIRPKHMAVKEAVFPFARFPGTDPVLSPEMKSTGEVMGSDTTFARAFLKAQLGAGTDLPTSGRVFISIRDEDKTEAMMEAARTLSTLGFTLLATRGTAAWLAGAEIACDVVNKVYEGRPNIVDLLKDGGIALVLNTTEGTQAVEDSKPMREVALYDKIPYFTTAAGAQAAAQAIASRDADSLEVTSLQELARA